MARKRADIGELGRALKAPAFENKDSTSDTAKLDPVSPTTLVLHVCDIKAYEHNPRHAENREYPRLKDSIRSRRGLTTPLTVTKRPGDDRYTIAAGGNSRLRALKELTEETGEEVFAQVTCRFEPWDSECQVLANHLIENDVRGNILFADKAQAILEWRRLYEETHPEEPPLSQRMLSDRLAEVGYRVPQSLLSRLIYAAEHLMPHLPKVFASGLGRRAVEQLIRLRTTCAQYWQDALAQAEPLPTETTFDDVFTEICAQQDCHCEDWDLDVFQRALTTRIAEALKVDHKLVALDTDSLYHGYSVEVGVDSDSLPAKDPQGLRSQWAFERSREIEARKAERARTRLEARGAARTPPESSHADSPPVSSELSALELMGGESGDFDTDDLRQLRTSNHAAAYCLAESHGLHPLLETLDTGHGYFIDAPEPPTASSDSLNPSTGSGEGVALAGIRSGLWWLLCFAADQLAPPHLAKLSASHPRSWLVELFTALPERSPDTDPLSALEFLVGQPSARSLVWEVLTHPSLSQEDMGALMRLLRGCRALRAVATQRQVSLWDAEA